MRVKLRDIAHARAGDKGDISNVSLIVFDPAHYDRVRMQVSPERVKAWFGPLVRGDVVRYELPQLGAFNFVMHEALGGGVTRSLALDPHGKSRSSFLLEMEIELEEACAPEWRNHALKEESMAQDEAARVAFWVEYMEQSYALAEAIMRHPLQESREGFASIPAAAEAAGVELHVSTTRLAGQFERLFFIRESLMPDLMAIARDMNARGWILKIEDGYRTRQMQTALGRAPAVFDRIVQACIRECGGGRPPVELVFRRAMCLVANVPLTGTHLAGAAVDISVLQRDDGAEVWRGKPYLEMSEYTPMDSPFVNAEERQHRQEITRVMERHGFLHYPGEFWHYNKGDSLYQIQARTGQPGRFGPVDWDRATNTVTSLANPSGLLTPLDVLESLIQQAMQRLAGRDG